MTNTSNHHHAPKADFTFQGTAGRHSVNDGHFNVEHSHDGKTVIREIAQSYTDSPAGYVGHY